MFSVTLLQWSVISPFLPPSLSLSLRLATLHSCVQEAHPPFDTQLHTRNLEIKCGITTNKN